MEEQKTAGSSDQQKPSADSDDLLCKKGKPVCESGIAESSLKSPSTEFLSSTLDVQHDKRLSIPDLEIPMPSTSGVTRSVKPEILSRQPLIHFGHTAYSVQERNVDLDLLRRHEMAYESTAYEDCMKTFRSYDEPCEKVQTTRMRQEMISCFSDENCGQAKISGTTGLRVDRPESPIEFFRLIANDIFFEYIIAQMNEYVKRPKLNLTESRYIDWRPVTREEFEICMGILLLYDVMNPPIRPDLWLFWLQPSIFNSLFFPAIMSKQRFWDILDLFLWVYFIRNESEDDSSDETKPFDVFHNNFMKNIYYPQKELAVKRSAISIMKEVTVEENTIDYKEIFHRYITLMNDEESVDECVKHYTHNHCLREYPLSLSLTIHLFYIIMYNSYVFFIRSSKIKLKFRKFRLLVIHALLHISPVDRYLKSLFDKLN